VGESESRRPNIGFNDGIHSATTAAAISVLDHTMMSGMYGVGSFVLGRSLGIIAKMRNTDALDGVS
jgi:hypothetical protein